MSDMKSVVVQANPKRDVKSAKLQVRVKSKDKGRLAKL